MRDWLELTIPILPGYAVRSVQDVADLLRERHGETPTVAVPVQVGTALRMDTQVWDLCPWCGEPQHPPASGMPGDRIAHSYNCVVLAARALLEAAP
jgi:hypothetical protein